MKRKICPYCNTDNPDVAVFCKKCGALFVGYPEYVDPVKDKQNKKNKIVFAVCVVLLVIALLVFKTGSSKEETADVTTQAPTTSQTTTLSPTATEAAAAETQTTAAAVATTEANATTATTTTAVTTTAATETDMAAICEKYNSLLGDLKSNKGTVRIHKIEKISMQITEFSLPVSMSAINSFMNGLIPQTDTVHNFSNGVSENKKTTLTELIPPSTKSAPEVTPEDLISATESPDGTITIKFKADSSSYTNGKTDFPLYVGSATDVLDFATFSLGPVKISSAEIEYPGTEITLNVDEDGNAKMLTIIQPVNVISTGGVGSLTANVGMVLKATTTYQVV